MFIRINTDRKLPMNHPQVAWCRWVYRVIFSESISVPCLINLRRWRIKCWIIDFYQMFDHRFLAAYFSIIVKGFTMYVDIMVFSKYFLFRTIHQLYGHQLYGHQLYGAVYNWFIKPIVALIVDSPTDVSGRRGRRRRRRMKSRRCSVKRRIRHEGSYDKYVNNSST